jgi:hypothetical protein
MSHELSLRLVPSRRLATREDMIGEALNLLRK